MSEFNKDRAALILVEASYFPDSKVAKNWSITQRTIQNYRKRLDSDIELSQLFTLKKEDFEQTWGNRITKSIVSSLDFLDRAGQEADPKDPATIHAVAGALKLIAEIGLAKNVIDARLAAYDRQTGITSNEVIASLPSQTD